MRSACLACVYKHLADAAVAETEFVMGYPKFKLWVVGNLSHAAQEAFRVDRRLALVIRQHRLNWMDDPRYTVPYEELGLYVDLCLQLSHQRDEIDLIDRDEIADRIVDSIPILPNLPDLPESCAAGIAKDALGGLLFDMDTRP